MCTYPGMQERSCWRCPLSPRRPHGSACGSARCASRAEFLPDAGPSFFRTSEHRDIVHSIPITRCRMARFVQGLGGPGTLMCRDGSHNIVRGWVQGGTNLVMRIGRAKRSRHATSRVTTSRYVSRCSLIFGQTISMCSQMSDICLPKSVDLST